MKYFLVILSLFGFTLLVDAGAVTAFELKCQSFENGDRIPVKYTCSGEDVSPPLSWEGVPEGTKSLVLICDDPDAPVGTWVHWVLYNLPRDIVGLGENVPPQKKLPNHALQGKNDFQRIGYGGPCPPPGRPHRYFFKLYALDTKLDADPGFTKNQVLQAMKGHIVGKAVLMGKYGR